jgi:two-component system chemotaxis response regulator CheB
MNTDNFMIRRSISDFVKNDFDLVVIGSSSGGIEALAAILSLLSKDFILPIVIVQHRAEVSPGLTDVLQTSCVLPVVEPEDKESIQAGHVYVAPSGYHLLIENQSFSLSIDGPVNWSRPSIDVLFESVAENFGSRVIGIVLTGRNDDGARGLARMKQFGAMTIVQDPSSAINRDMPDSAIAGSVVDHILNLTDIADLLLAADRFKRGAHTNSDVAATQGGM